MASVNHQITTITFLKFKGLEQKWWAMRQMRDANDVLKSVPGLCFYKLLGSGGGNGFSIIPDTSTYALLLVWEDRTFAEAFFKHHPYCYRGSINTLHQWTVFLEATKVRGTWQQQQPFSVRESMFPDGPIAVVTRATIHLKKLWSFWKNVPKVSDRLRQHQAGLLFSKGIGEFPLTQQATFSLWKSRDAMVQYAYHSAKHREMIKKTRQLGWYREELFAEFTLTKVRGYWPNVPDLSAYLPDQLSNRSA
ncbi:spheroidene monooxygenase [Tunicatimonas pelagia]|uniref:spheroidene monooxygenase n=1 Tax=Tunicatimonas pelagia TaxID=931531 RepID=UPI00266508FB|nr:spheroidene monooxygenase [Tunicatimonas pelagia]WKN44075.1 spheroidene monooxygenase [Tunicatimonas pelagia]